MFKNYINNLIDKRLSVNTAQSFDSVNNRIKLINNKLNKLNKLDSVPLEIIPIVAAYSDIKAREYDSNDPRMSMMHDAVSTLCTYLAIAADARKNGADIVETLKSFSALIETSDNIVDTTK